MAISQTTYTSIDQLTSFGQVVDTAGPYVLVASNPVYDYLWIFKRESGVLIEKLTKWKPVAGAYRLLSAAGWYDPDADLLHFIAGWIFEDAGGYTAAGRVRCCTYDGVSDPVVRASFDGFGTDSYYGVVVGIDKRTGRWAYGAARNSFALANQKIQILRRENDFDWYVDHTFGLTDYTPNFASLDGRNDLWVDDSGNVNLVVGDTGVASVQDPAYNYKYAVDTFRMVSDANMGGAPPPSPLPGSCYVVNNWGGSYSNGDLMEWRGSAGWNLVHANIGGNPPPCRVIVSKKVPVGDLGGTFSGKPNYIFQYSGGWDSGEYPSSGWVCNGAYNGWHGTNALFIFDEDFDEWLLTSIAGGDGGAIYILRRASAGSWPLLQRLESVTGGGSYAQCVKVNKVLPNKTILVTGAWTSPLNLVIYRLTDHPTKVFVPEEAVPILSGYLAISDARISIGYRLLIFGGPYDDSEAGTVFVKVAYEDGTFAMEVADYALQQTGHQAGDKLSYLFSSDLAYQEGGYVRIVAGVPIDVGTPAGSIVEFDGDVDFPALPGGQGEWPPVLPPSAPSGLDATAGEQQNTITWDPVDGATSYNLYWSLSAGVTEDNNLLEGVSSPYLHINLIAEQEYFYAVAAVGAGGQGSLSNEDSAIPYAFPSPVADSYEVTSSIQLVSKEPENYTIKVHPITKKRFEGWKWDKTAWVEDKDE